MGLFSQCTERPYPVMTLGLGGLCRQASLAAQRSLIQWPSYRQPRTRHTCAPTPFPRLPALSARAPLTLAL